MRLSELRGSTVHAWTGRAGRAGEAYGDALGVVTDVRLAQIGPPSGALGQLVVESLLVSPRHAGSLFGYERGVTRGPWLIAAAVRRLHRGAFLVAWDDVAETDPGNRRVVLREHARRQPAAGTVTSR